VVGMHFNGVSNSLYAAEFPNTFGMIKAGLLTSIQLIEWIMLLMVHVVIVCLPFLTRRKYFKGLLIWAPLSFIIIYMLYASVFVVVLLIPFIIVWIIALVAQFARRTSKQL
jgi:hypothetical protein